MSLLAQAVLISMGFLQKIVRAASEKIRNIRGARDNLSLAQRYGDVPAEVERLTGLTAAELMLKFESLGDNCEFGLVQQRCGADPLGLLRFSWFGLSHLMLALDSNFAELGALRNMEVFVAGQKPEYFVRDRKYELVTHTFQYVEDGADNTVIACHSARFEFLCRKLQEDLAAGEKILVLKRDLALNDEEIGEVHRLLQRYGRNTLLAVLPASQGRGPGTVEIVRPGLLKAYIDRFAPFENAHDTSFELWLNICARTYLLNLRRQETIP